MKSARSPAKKSDSLSGPPATTRDGWVPGGKGAKARGKLPSFSQLVPVDSKLSPRPDGLIPMEKRFVCTLTHDRDLQHQQELMPRNGLEQKAYSVNRTYFLKGCK